MSGPKEKFFFCEKLFLGPSKVEGLLLEEDKELVKSVRIIFFT